MKPQCETAADCLRELARVMEQFGIADPVEAIAKYGRWEGIPISNASLVFSEITNNPDLLTLAIAEIEGKPVFIGDTVYDYAGEAHIVPYLNDGTKMNFGDRHEWSLTSSKPKTVMVEIEVEDAERAAKFWLDDQLRVSARIGAACKKALEKLK